MLQAAEPVVPLGPFFYLSWKQGVILRIWFFLCFSFDLRYFVEEKKNCPKHVPPLASLRHLTLTENTPYSIRLTCARNVVYISYLKEISGLLVKDFINFLVIWAHSSRYDHINWLICTQILHFSTQHWTIVKQSHNLHLYFSWSGWWVFTCSGSLLIV